MGSKCVFLDRDNTIIEDPGYLSDPSAVKLLPGVDLALKSLIGAGFKLVVVTNQAAIARGVLTEEGLERIHEEMRHQLSERGVQLDGVYYCPFHPEGTVAEFARESQDRKPQPGMLLRAASELDLDLTHSWMVGDSPRDIEAGQRAGCRTVRVRVKGQQHPGDKADEDVQADFTVRSLVDAARTILREIGAGAMSAAAVTASRGADPEAGEYAGSGAGYDAASLREVLRDLRDATRQGEEEFSFARLVGAILQILAILALAWGLLHLPDAADHGGEDWLGSYVRWHVATITAGVLQLMALTFFVIARKR
ncbi:MAG: D-glycero-alpha-D-manno-heptose-1,7-bisphosphate 7-phosphatase [Planctomycetota bacterium]|jgi:D,D-heptose 1,7-bisphosphate phosphatase